MAVPERLGLSVTLAAVICAGSPIETIAAPADPLAPRASYEDLMVEAEAQRDEGAYAESAALYAKAYRSRPEKQRADEVGLFIVKNAIKSFDLALAQVPQGGDQRSRQIALLADKLELMDEFIASRKIGDAPALIIEQNTETAERLDSLRQEAASVSSHDVALGGPAGAANLHDSTHTSTTEALTHADAYDTLDDDAKGGPQGTKAVLKSVRSYCTAYSRDRNEDHLLAARALLASFSGHRIARELSVPPEIKRKQQQVNEAILNKSGCENEPPLYVHVPVSSVPMSPAPRACEDSADCGGEEQCGTDNICHARSGHGKFGAGISIMTIGTMGGALGGFLLANGDPIEATRGVLLVGISVPLVITGGVLTGVGAKQLWGDKSRRQRKRSVSARPSMLPTATISGRIISIRWRF